jgi:hypothetical protein
MAWVTVDALAQHWDQARVEARLDPTSGSIRLETRNVTALTLALDAGQSPFDPLRTVTIQVGGETLEAGRPHSDRSWTASIRREGGRWILGASPAAGLRKRHGLQGPVDDAFMDSFLFVRPTGPALNAVVGGWVERELNRAIEQWRRQYRGDVRIKDDTAVTESDMAQHHLVLWGDPQSNKILGQMATKLGGIRWDSTGVHTPAAGYPVDRFAPILIHPNPLHPDRYVVVNSGFTFREYDLLNNARQTPKLPDWAIIDLGQAPNARTPGGITAAGFFDESWTWKP